MFYGNLVEQLEFDARFPPVMFLHQNWVVSKHAELWFFLAVHPLVH